MSWFTSFLLSSVTLISKQIHLNNIAHFFHRTTMCNDIQMELFRGHVTPLPTSWFGVGGWAEACFCRFFLNRVEQRDDRKLTLLLWGSYLTLSLIQNIFTCFLIQSLQGTTNHLLLQSNLKIKKEVKLKQKWYPKGVENGLLGGINSEYNATL